MRMMIAMVSASHEVLVSRCSFSIWQREKETTKRDEGGVERGCLIEMLFMIFQLSKMGIHQNVILTTIHILTVGKLFWHCRLRFFAMMCLFKILARIVALLPIHESYGHIYEFSCIYQTSERQRIKRVLKLWLNRKNFCLYTTGNGIAFVLPSKCIVWLPMNLLSPILYYSRCWIWMHSSELILYRPWTNTLSHTHSFDVDVLACFCRLSMHQQHGMYCILLNDDDILIRYWQNFNFNGNENHFIENWNDERRKFLVQTCNFKFFHEYDIKLIELRLIAVAALYFLLHRLFREKSFAFLFFSRFFYRLIRPCPRTTIHYLGILLKLHFWIPTHLCNVGWFFE